MPKVKLRPLERKDLDNMMAWVNDPEVIKNFARFSGEITREEEAGYLERMLASETDRVFAIENEEGDYLGNIGLHQIYWPARNARLGVILGNKAQQGKGYGQAAINEILRIAFNEHKLHKVWLMTFKENEKAQHVYRKCGFKVEGLLREEYILKERYHDMVRMSILEQEYQERSRGQ